MRDGFHVPEHPDSSKLTPPRTLSCELKGCQLVRHMLNCLIVAASSMSIKRIPLPHTIFKLMPVLSRLYRALAGSPCHCTPAIAYAAACGRTCAHSRCTFAIHVRSVWLPFAGNLPQLRENYSENSGSIQRFLTDWKVEVKQLL